MSENEIPEELRALESSLRGLSPAAAAIDERAIYFRAGQAASRRQYWAWQSLAAAALMLAAGLGVMLAVSSGQERIVYVDHGERPTPLVPPSNVLPSEDSPPAPRSGQLAQGSYLQLRQQWSQAEGADDWVPPPPSPGSPCRNVLNGLLN